MIKLEKAINNSRILYALKRYGYNYVEDLLDLSEEEVLKIPNIGKKSADELIDFLKNYSSNYSPQAKEIPFDFTETERNFLIDAVLDKRVTNLRARRIKQDCLNKLKGR